MSYFPDGTLIIYGNELPEIEFEGDAMWGRLLIAPFEVSIPKDRQDKDLQWKFDRAGILAWIIKGHS